ncbi:MAG: PadR family transcriptional regulator [Thermoplasmata archaeon]|jgi:DNA-binding PadR family transcriptional regulator|nr:PadR family transcriptional regulator [Thermoplasmata archaeon]
MPRKSKDENIGAACCRAPECCDMRGMLSFLILHLLSTKDRYGMEIAAEIAKRKADKPNPGTIYPTLKQLESKGLIESYHSEGIKLYKLTPEGRDGLRQAKRFFVQAYGDILKE